MKSNLSKILSIVYFAAVGIYTWPLIFKIPKTLRVVFEAFRPGGFGVADRDFWAFNRSDAGFRPWYTKIANDYHSQGRFGYVWDDGLGMPLGVRIYNNWGTYKLLNLLGHRRMMALGYVLMIVATILVVSLHFGWLVGILSGLLAAGSPMIVGAYTHTGKPEVFWWAFAIPLIYFGLAGQGLWAGFGWSALTIFNLSVSYMIILLLGPALLIALFLHGTLLVGLAGVIPGIGKNMIRLTYMWRSGFMGSITSEQARLWKLPLRPTRSEMIWWFPFLLSIGLSMYGSGTPIVGLLLVIFGVSVYWLNRRLIYMNDLNSFHMAYWVIALTYAAYSQSTTGLFSIFIILYQRQIACGIPPLANSFVTTDNFTWECRSKNLTNELKEFPNLDSMKLPQPETLMHFFDQIPNGSRVIAESDGDPRAESRFRAFWQWTEEFLPARQVDIVSEMYTRAVEPDLVDKYLTPFSSQHMTEEEMRRICQILGVSHIVVHTRETAALLKVAGYHAIATVDLAPLDKFREIIYNLPPVELKLFEISDSETIITPAVSWSRKANELKWAAESNQSYIIRYRYSPEFRAFQHDQELAVAPFKPMSDLPLQFMQVTAVMDGPVTLTFHPHWC